MTGENPTRPESPHEAYLAEKLAASQAENPQWPLLRHRMGLIQTLHREQGLSATDARVAVDEFLRAKGLGVPQPSLWFAAVFAVIVAVVLVGPFLAAYLLWQYFAAP